MICARMQHILVRDCGQSKNVPGQTAQGVHDTQINVYRATSLTLGAHAQRGLL